MAYKVYDYQDNDYLPPYNSKKNWTLEEAADLAYRLFERSKDEVGEEGYEAWCYKNMNNLNTHPSERMVAEALAIFDYGLERSQLTLAGMIKL